MTYAEAKRILSQPLIFGEPKQIYAHKFMEQVLLIEDEIEACRHEFDEYSEDIAECHYRARGESEIDATYNDAVDEAAKRWKKRKREARTQ